MKQRIENKNRSLEYYLSLPYTIETTANSDGSIFIMVKELPGCMSEGDNIVDAYNIIADAKKLWLETAIEDNLEIPLPEVMRKL